MDPMTLAMLVSTLNGLVGAGESTPPIVPRNDQQSGASKVMGRLNQGAQIGATLSQVFRPQQPQAPQLRQPMPQTQPTNTAQQFLAMLMQGYGAPGQGGFY